MTSYENGAAFRPGSPALREDVTVALVKLKGYDTDDVDFSSITKFNDQNSISDSCKKYVAVAVDKGLISGFEDDTFRGQDTLTRAEAAILLWRAFQTGNDDKVVDGGQTPAGDVTQTPASTTNPTPSETPNTTPTTPEQPTTPESNTTTITENSFTGTLTYTGQVNRYAYTAGVSGGFRFDLVSDFRVDMLLYRENEEYLHHISAIDNDGFNISLEKGRKYIIYIRQSENFPNTNAYTVKIGVPNAPTFIDLPDLAAW
jgi:hypothetical protein